MMPKAVKLDNQNYVFEPTDGELQLDNLNQENAKLWHDVMIKDEEIGTLEEDIAQLWYELMMGGK